MTQTPAANASWFNFTAQSGDFGVYAFSGFEEVCKPYEFNIELVSRSANVDLTALLGTPACLSIADRSGGERLVHGLLREREQLHTAHRFTHYRGSLLPEGAVPVSPAVPISCSCLKIAQSLGSPFVGSINK